MTKDGVVTEITDDELFGGRKLTNYKYVFRCVAVDMRGYGDSEKPEGLSAYKIDVLVEDVRDFMRKLGKVLDIVGLFANILKRINVWIIVLTPKKRLKESG